MGLYSMIDWYVLREFLGADLRKVMKAYMPRSPKLAFYWRNSNVYSNKILFHLMYVQTNGFFFLLFIFLTMLQNKYFGRLKLSVVSKVNIPAVRAVIILVVNWPDTGSYPIKIPGRLK